MTPEILDADLEMWSFHFGEGKGKHMTELRSTIEPQIKIMEQLPGILGMSPQEFQQFLDLPQEGDVPPDAPQQTLTIYKLVKAVAAKGGKLTLEIAIGDSVVRIPDDPV